VVIVFWLGGVDVNLLLEPQTTSLSVEFPELEGKTVGLIMPDVELAK
jgi:hypothetical protein